MTECQNTLNIMDYHNVINVFEPEKTTSSVNAYSNNPTSPENLKHEYLEGNQKQNDVEIDSENRPTSKERVLENANPDTVITDIHSSMSTYSPLMGAQKEHTQSFDSVLSNTNGIAVLNQAQFDTHLYEPNNELEGIILAKKKQECDVLIAFSEKNHNNATEMIVIDNSVEDTSKERITSNIESYEPVTGSKDLSMSLALIADGESQPSDFGQTEVLDEYQVEREELENEASDLDSQQYLNTCQSIPDNFESFSDNDGINITDERIVKSHNLKKRRRILIPHEDDTDNEEEERNRLLRSVSPTTSQRISPQISDEDSLAEKALSDLVRNEKPGPKSKKASTQILKELKARALLRNAVMIPVAHPDVKKRKTRILDSDEEDHRVNVDDIGKSDINCSITTCDNLSNGTHILISESEQMSMDMIGIDDAKPILPIENPLIECQPSIKIENTAYIVGTVKTNIHNAINENNVQLEITSEEFSPIDKNLEGDKKTVSSSIFNSDPESSSDNLSNRSTSNENCNQSEADVYIPDKHFVDTSSTSDSDGEFLPNDVYFGTPDKLKISATKSRGRPRGRPLSKSATLRIDTINSRSDYVATVPRGALSRRRGRPPIYPKFIDNRSQSSSASSSSESHSSNSKNPIAGNSYQSRLPATTERQLHTMLEPRYQLKAKTKDRFYDKSREIPNDVYFGDVDVPLHILHSYGLSGSSDEGSSFKNKGSLNRRETTKAVSSNISRGYHRGGKHSTISIPVQTVHKSNPGRRGRPTAIPTNVSRSGEQLINSMKQFLQAAGMKKVKLNKLWEGCKSQQERADKILDLLREKGLEGEPTIAKCKQLRKEIQTKEEIEDLDPNLILQTEGRTRRSATRAATHRNYTYEDEDIQDTMVKLKKVIDSDSDFD